MDTEGGSVRLCEHNVDRAWLTNRINATLSSLCGDPLKRRLDSGNDRSWGRLGRPGLVEEAGNRRSQLRTDPELDQQRGRVVGRPDLVSAVVEERARGARGGIEGRNQVLNEVLDLRVGENRAAIPEQRGALVHASTD